jgi:hypothetical protein
MTIHPALESHPGSALLAPAHAQCHKDRLQGSRRWRDKGWRPHQIAVIATVESRRWIAAHDALQQHSTRKLKTPPFEETLGGHDRPRGTPFKSGVTHSISSMPANRSARELWSLIVMTLNPLFLYKPFNGNLYKIRITRSKFQAPQQKMN